jgi:hypothetical protein
MAEILGQDLKILSAQSANSALIAAGKGHCGIFAQEKRKEKRNADWILCE